MPLDLTPLVSGTEALTPITADTRTMVPAPAATEALTPEEGLHPVAGIFTPGTLPGPTTYPDAGILSGGGLCGQFLCGEGQDLYPDDNFVTDRTGLWLEANPVATETLTPLTED